MPWARLDDKFWGHPKIVGLPHAAIGVYALSLSYAADQLTDGVLPSTVVKSWRDGPAVKALMDAGLWEPAPGGFRIHDYLDYNASREQVLAARAATAGRQQKWRAGRRDSGRPDGVTDSVPDGVTNTAPYHSHPEDAPHGASVPTPYPLPIGALLEPAARRAEHHTTSSADAIATLYGPPQQPERLPNGAQQCPLCPEIFTGSYAEHLDSPRHKVRDEPDDLSGFHG